MEFRRKFSHVIFSVDKLSRRREGTSFCVEIFYFPMPSLDLNIRLGDEQVSRAQTRVTRLAVIDRFFRRTAHQARSRERTPSTALAFRARGAWAPLTGGQNAR